MQNQKVNYILKRVDTLKDTSMGMPRMAPHWGVRSLRFKMPDIMPFQNHGILSHNFNGTLIRGFPLNN